MYLDFIASPPSPRANGPKSQASTKQKSQASTKQKSQAAEDSKPRGEKKTLDKPTKHCTMVFINKGTTMKNTKTIKATNPWNGQVCVIKSSKVNYTHAVAMKVTCVEDYTTKNQMWLKECPGEGWVLSHRDEQGLGYWELTFTMPKGSVHGYWQKDHVGKVYWRESCYICSHHRTLNAATKQASAQAKVKDKGLKYETVVVECVQE